MKNSDESIKITTIAYGMCIFFFIFDETKNKSLAYDMTQIMKDILKLSISERILMVEAIWDSIAETNEQLELSAETKQLLDQRLENHKSNPEEGSNWNIVKARIKNQF